MADRHKNKGDRHKPGYVRPSRRNAKPPGRPRTKPLTDAMPKGWNGHFIAVDGEGWKGRYNLLACSALDYDLYSARGLPTRACLSYLSSWGVKSGDALIGFGLSYDFENLLRDVPDEDYKKLLLGEKINFFEFEIKAYIPRKFIEIKKKLNSVDKNGKPRTKTIFLQDVLGFFQTSFIKALEKFNIPVPAIIEEGKAMRGEFKAKDLPFIKRYNREELRLLIELMESLRTSGKEAFEAINLKPNFTPRTWFGPGAWASNFLRQTDWVKEHPPFAGLVFKQLQDEMEAYLDLSPWKINSEKKELEKLILEIEQEKKLIMRGKKELLATVEGDLFREIRQLGGIAPSVAWQGEYRESIPRTLKRKKGRPLDAIADGLGYSVTVLLDHIRDYRPETGTGLDHQARIAAEMDPEWYALTDTQHGLAKAWVTQADLIPDKKAMKEIADLRQYPFAAAFFGGRIESAAVGEFRGNFYDYDINSAYPFAIANLPWWDESDLRRVEGFDALNRIGMYYVSWDCPEGANFYPFPYRSGSGNVFYPRQGSGWYMAPEVFAALQVWGDSVHVSHGYVLVDTDGAGDGVTRLPEAKLCTTARKIAEMAVIRMKAKKEGMSYEKPLKLVMNSVFGKLIQQVGSHKFLTPFAASWITATCRSIISRSIKGDDAKNIISIMTDGILSKTPLPVDLGDNLGQFELKEFTHVIQFMPGVYLLENEKTGKKESKYRGMDKTFDPETAKNILWEEYWEEKIKEGDEIKSVKHGAYPVKINVFVTRNLALHQPNKYDAVRYQFTEITKEEEFTLRSKRASGPKGFRLLKGDENRFFAPKEMNRLEWMAGLGSRPYTLDLPAEKEFDTAESKEMMTDEEHINSLLEIDNFDLRG